MPGCKYIYIYSLNFKFYCLQVIMLITNVHPLKQKHNNNTHGEILFYFILFYLFIWQRERTQAGVVAEGEADLPPSREPDAGPDPRTLKSWPESRSRVRRLTDYATQVLQWPPCFNLFSLLIQTYQIYTKHNR